MHRSIAKRGFSLIEVLIFISITTSFFVIAVGLTSRSLQQMKSSENRIIAGYLTNELMEWLRGEKETDWSGRFLTRTPVSGTVTYCFNASPITSWPSAGSCGTYALRSVFSREVMLTRQALIQPGQYQVNVSITTRWQEAGGSQSITSNTVFNALE